MLRAGTAGRGTSWDRGPCTALYEAAPPAVGSTGTIGRVRAAGATRRRMLISAPPAARPFLGSRAASGPEELRDSEWTCTSTHAYLGTADRGTRKGTVGCDSEWSHGCRRDAVTFCFQYLVQQVTVSDGSTTFFCIGLLHSELGVAIQILPFELGSQSIKADGEETRRSSYNPNRV